MKKINYIFTPLFFLYVVLYSIAHLKRTVIKKLKKDVIFWDKRHINVYFCTQQKVVYVYL